MSRRWWSGIGAVALVVGVGILVRQCDPITITAPTFFMYGSHERPRVFVAHHPLIPAPGATLTIELVPDLPADVTVTKAFASLHHPADGAATTKPCDPVGNAFACTFALGPSPGPARYGGYLDLSTGGRVRARAEYRFTVAGAPAPDALVEVRVPVNATAGLADSYRLDTAFVRDPTGYEMPPFLADAERSVYDGILADPVYRWRDDQLGFFVFTREAFVTSYYSGRDTRCGRNPWPLETGWPTALGAIEVLGVLHRKATSTQGIEGGVTEASAGLFRDCAARAVRRPSAGTFSVSTGIGPAPFIARHEFGHAAFTLGDEYTEPDATRRVTTSTPAPSDSECCCLVSDDGGATPGGGVIPGGGGVTPGGVGGVTPGAGTRGPRLVPRQSFERCLRDGVTTTTPMTGSVLDGLTTCDAQNPTGTFEPSCGAGVDTGCPSLAGGCVSDTAWLGQSPPSGADTRRPNVFATQEACNEALPRASEHPGVEDPARSLGLCRELCGPNTSACPCGAPQFWVVDLNPTLAPAPVGTQDAMALVSTAGPRHGGTCTWCVETTLCVRWHRALGDTPEKAWEACQAPPKSLTGFERAWNALLRCLAILIAKILEVVRF